MRSRFHQAFFLFVFISFVIFPRAVSADTLFISPLSGAYSLGQTFTVRVLVSSPGTAINAISGVLSFPTDKLQVTSVSKIGSVLSLWVQEPTFSNSKGIVSFEGVVPNPGFNESDGRVLSITFKVVGTGSAPVRLSSGSLLANDGYGSNVLKTLGMATFTLSAAQAEPVQTVVTPPAVIEVTNDAGGSADISPQQNGNDKAQFKLPSLRSVLDWLLKLLSVAIPLFALIFLLTHVTIGGVSNIRTLRRKLRKDLHQIDRLVEKSFDILREDISDSIHILERARTRRTLTAEEDAIIHRLRQNLVDAEKIIHKEVLSAEKDIGD